MPDGATKFFTMKNWNACGRAVPSIALAVNVALVADWIKASPWEAAELIPAVMTSTSSGPTFTMAGVGDLPNPAVYRTWRCPRSRSYRTLATSR